MWYIKEARSIDEVLDNKQLGLPKLFQKMLYSFRVRSGRGRLRQIENGYIYIIPVKLKKEKIEIKKLKKVCSKMEKILNRYSIRSVAISDFLDNIENFKNFIYMQDIHILDGRNLFHILAIDCLKYIADQREIPLENMEVTVLVNDTSDINIENIKLIAQNVKIISVVTNHINKFKSIQEQIYEDYGTFIKVSNNQKKSLSRSKIILNMDFPEELLSKYNVFGKAILINLSENVKIRKKSFDGVIVQNYETVLPLKYIQDFKISHLYEDFNRNVLCESVIAVRDSFSNLRKKVEREKVDIYKLIGNNGYILEEEFKKSIDKT